MIKTLILGLVVFSTSLFSQGYNIENYAIEIELSKDGYYDIQETINVNFLEKRRGIFRNIPKSYKINGKTQKIRLSKISVKNYQHKRLSEGNDYVIRIGNKRKYLIGQHTYIINYRIANAFIFAADHIAFQYNLISDWDTPIQNLSYQITLPDDLALDSDEVSMMTGAKGESKKHVSLSVDRNQISGRSLTTIPTRENVTLALKLPLGYVAEPINPLSLEAAKRKKSWVIPLLLSFLTFGYYKRKAKEEPLGQIHDQYFPPEGFSPPVVGAYYDHKVHTEDIISLLPYWANLGYVKMLKGLDIVYFKKVSELPADSPYYQQSLFDKIFEDEDMIVLEDLNTKLGALVSNMKGQLHKDIIDRDLYDEDHNKLFHKGAFLVLGSLLFIGAIVAGAKFQNVFLTLALGLFGILSFVIHGSRPRLNDHGIELKRKLLGLKQFLTNADPAKVSELVKTHPNYFQQMYPYAIAFRIDRTWINKLEEMNMPPPTWYESYGGSGSNASSHSSKPSMKDFSKDFNVPEIASVFTSVPKPPPGSSRSSGGGFGGGGAGGGFGGGGGSW